MATRALCEPALGPGEQLVEEAPGGPRLCLAQEASFLFSVSHFLLQDSNLMLLTAHRWH